MDILDEGNIDKDMEVLGKLYTVEKSGGNFMRSSVINISNNQVLIF